MRWDMRTTICSNSHDTTISLLSLCLCLGGFVFAIGPKTWPGQDFFASSGLPSPLSSSFTNWNQLAQHFYFNAFVLIPETDRQFGGSLTFLYQLYSLCAVERKNFPSCSNVAVGKWFLISMDVYSLFYDTG